MSPAESLTEITEVPESVYERYDPERDVTKALTVSCSNCSWETTVRASDTDGSVYREAAWRAARHEESLGRHRVGQFNAAYVDT